MFWAKLFSRNRFDSKAKAVKLLKLVNRASVSTPVRFGTFAPLRQAYDATDLSEPSQLLAGRKEGYIRLKGAKHKFEAGFGWSETGVATWDVQLETEFFSSQERIEQFISFMVELCSEFPILFGGAAPEEDWRAKNWLTQHYPGGGKSSQPMGLSLEGCLPGIYWMTIFGASAVEHFGRKKLEKLPAHSTQELGQSGLALVLRPEPLKPELQKRLGHDEQIVEQLGRQYFFDIKNPKKDCRPVPGVTEPKPDDIEEDDELAAAPAEDFDEFENQTILNPEGKPYTHPRQMAEDTVVYFHPHVDEVFDYSRASLRALDEYFAAHPQKTEYTRDHVFTELIPGLGSYLGEVLVKRLGGKWVKREPILKSSVKVKSQELTPFRVAFNAVYDGAKLMEAFDSAKKAS